MELIIKQCGECKRTFAATSPTDYICDKCSEKLFPGHLPKAQLGGRKWEDKAIKKQWQKASYDSMKAINDKCKGTNYGN